MSRRPPRPVRLLASALAAGALLAVAACSDGGSGAAPDTAEQARPASAAVVPPAADEAAASPSASPGTLTRAGAKAALITEADLEADWTQVDDADTWRDSLLVGKVDVADFLTAKADAQDCQKLLDRLYSQEALGKPSGASAVTGFRQGDSRLFEQVAAYDGALDDAWKWFGSLPRTCDEFTTTGGPGGKRTVQVIETPMPEVGDARQGLRVTVKGTANGEPTTLTLDVAAVRVGDNALTVTGGGLSGGQAESVSRGVKQGTERLKTVLAGGTPSPNPSEFD
ncbi:hypothetical protein [Streptomyces sp. SID8352]|uniref:hypothetical protein n=1 Tax=Streptomyces sp. SID8352 TaxID=2690338 RepID=UPI00136DE83E|nr:hypothetical protein [Streptomyces sp. SID8352]MYU24103.1 hypothetical protein [Streptomyces sp. SID8352]